MRFRPLTLIAAIIMLVLIYGVAGGLIVRRIFLRFYGYMPRAELPPWLIRFYIVLAAVEVAYFILEASFYFARRRNRSRRGYCAHCGRRLQHDLLRCLYCGTRVVSASRVEPRFEVIIGRNSTPRKLALQYIKRITNPHELSPIFTNEYSNRNWLFHS